MMFSFHKRVISTILTEDQSEWQCIISSHVKYHNGELLARTSPTSYYIAPFLVARGIVYFMSQSRVDPIKLFLVTLSRATRLQSVVLGYKAL
ncbi:hypothetical protein DSO57_1005812 [Entomophthora muscae]|uniref:Uncharacterized protein n=1 Tax=Entomophthora muscae TaxID=34485 RepID=A0ACC2TII9_9FUNG|nr:hypothetical protein DSO57_1005812 [Entomophthora muscae]